MAFRTNKTPVLQTKSASGSVATFNTALAMPLASCNIAVTATQSGSGTPSPDNVRTINGYSNIGISATGKNLFDKDAVTLGKWITGTGTEHNSPNGAYSSYIPIITNIPYYFSHIIGDSSFYSIVVYDEDKIFIETVNIRGGNDSSRTITFTQGSYIRVNVYKAYLDIVQVELGSIATAFEPFGTYTTIQIGSTVYGGEYDARSGVLTANVKTRVFNGAGSEDWGDYPSGNGYSFSSIVDMQSIVLYDGLCNWLKVRTTVDNTDTNAIYIGVGNRNIYAVGVKAIAPTLADWRTYLSTNNLIITYPLATPTTIQLPPCPIDTLEVNNIWADTGDIDLTYKDLDIAKRGNFREVFKLPS